MLGVEGDVVPVVLLVVVGRIRSVAVLLLLGDEGPLLIELDLGRPGGKLHEVIMSGPGMVTGQAAVADDSVGGRRGRAGRSGGRRTPRRRAPGPIRPAPRGVNDRARLTHYRHSLIVAECIVLELE
jgi:hypothetical protein